MSNIASNKQNSGSVGGENIQKKQNEILEKKKQSQPSQIKTCGSTFKNISNEKKVSKKIHFGIFQLYLLK